MGIMVYSLFMGNAGFRSSTIEPSTVNERAEAAATARAQQRRSQNQTGTSQAPFCFKDL